jgi:hypothetical protein
VKPESIAVSVIGIRDEKWASFLGSQEIHHSCHTAAIDGYAIEGHVPAREIRRLLDQRPQAIGLAAPGMPIGAPGMDVAWLLWLTPRRA